MNLRFDSNSPVDTPGGPGRLFTATVASRLLFGGAALAMVLGLFARWSVFAEILTHFRVVYALATVVAVGLAVFLRRWKLTAACAFLLLWQLAGILPWYMRTGPAVHAAADTIKLLSANVNEHNGDHKKFLELIARENPDVVLVQELSPAWSEALANLYPYHSETARRDYFGLGLYSRYPIENMIDSDPVRLGVPQMRADIDVDGNRIHVLNLHLAAPESTSLLKLRARQFPWLADYVAAHEGPVIVAGDLNCTMWSPLYKDIVKRGKVISVREGRGVMATWLPLGPLNLLPLDHVLVRGAAIVDARLAERIGSDHCPIIAEISLPQGGG